MSPWEQKRVFLFSHPRTASNLFMRFVSAQQDWQVSDYFFWGAYQYFRKEFHGLALEDVPQDVQDKYQEMIEQAHEKLEKSVFAAKEQGKHVLHKEHTFEVAPVESLYGEQQAIKPLNPSLFSDEMLLSWRPVILIRNPILVYESWLRAEGKPYEDLYSQRARLCTTLRYQRAIFDWYRKNPQCSVDLQPIVIDADDIIERQDVMEKLCDLVGMRKEDLMFSWKASPLPARIAADERNQRFLGTIYGSTGAKREKASTGITLESRMELWKEEFGAERAEILGRRVNESWEDYMYLRDVRLC